MIDVKASPWSEVAETYLRQAVNRYQVEDLRALHFEGASLFVVTENGVTCGAYMLRFDQAFEGLEGVIVAAAGNVNGMSLTDALLPYIQAQMISRGCFRARVHTNRPGLVKVLNAKGWATGEFVLYKRLD